LEWGLAIGDIDNDGFPDLYATSFGTDQLWFNNGDGTFSEIAEVAGITGNRWSTAASFFDYDGDGALDLLVASLCQFLPRSGFARMPPATRLLRTWRFSARSQSCIVIVASRRPQRKPVADVTVASGIASIPGKGLGLITRDFNGDLLPDVFVANDMEANRLWVQSAEGRLRRSRSAGVAYNHSVAAGQYGRVCDDLNGDGQFDLFVTHLHGERIHFCRRPDGQFRDETARSGLGLPSLPFTGFGVAALDVEHERRSRSGCGQWPH